MRIILNQHGKIYALSLSATKNININKNSLFMIYGYMSKLVYLNLHLPIGNTIRLIRSRSRSKIFVDLDLESC